MPQAAGLLLGSSLKQNHCSASDSIGLIFTRSYRSMLLITTPTTTLSLVKTSLYKIKKAKKTFEYSHNNYIQLLKIL